MSAPPTVFRLIYLVAMIFPAYLKAPRLLIPVTLCFTAISAYGFSCSYLPTEYYYYTYSFLVLVVASIMFRHNEHISIPSLLVVFALYILLIDFFNNEKLENIEYSFFAMLMSLFFVSKTGEEYCFYPIAFAVVSLALCYFFFTVGDQFTIEVQGQDRVMWKDPNYMGSVVGMGVVCSYNEVMNNENLKKWVRSLYLFTIGIGVVMLLMNASRGATLATAIGMSMLTIFSKIKPWKKILFLGFVIISILILHNLNMFDALQQRMAEDDGTGNARTIIWAYKYEGYMRGTFMQKMFGIGYHGGFMLGTIGGYGFHNDYLAFLVDYGLVGLVLFLTMLIYPIWMVRKNSSQKVIVTTLVLFLATCCATVEPLTAGRLAYFYFYMYILILANKKNSRYIK